MKFLMALVILATSSCGSKTYQLDTTKIVCNCDICQCEPGKPCTCEGCKCDACKRIKKPDDSGLADGDHAPGGGCNGGHC